MLQPPSMKNEPDGIVVTGYSLLEDISSAGEAAVGSTAAAHS
jgi:hypothetical protein